MHPYLLLLQLLIIILVFLSGVPKSSGVDDERYLNCSQSFGSIGYPFRGSNRPDYCGFPGFKLNCSSDAPSISIQEQEFRVLSINQSQSSFTIARADYWNNVCPVSLTNTTTQDIYGRKRTIVIATVSATAGLLAIVFGYFLWKKTLGKRSETIKYLSAAGVENDTELPLFSLRSILVATNNFSEANKLGEGGFGPVYKGILPENQEVAIKRLSKKSGQGQQEFMNELKLIAKLQHTNLVRLLGCCTEAEEMMLIYEYMPNRSLDKFLFDPSEKTKLDWDRRLRIIEAATCHLSMHVMVISLRNRMSLVLEFCCWRL